MTASALSEASERDLPSTPDSETERRGWALRLAPYLAVLAGVAAVAWHATRYKHWIVDDAAITFSYARSFADGLGPVLQPGAPPVEGFSDPTWMVLLALGKVAGLFDHGLLLGIPDYVLFPKLLGLLFTGGILAGFQVAARQVFRRHAWAITLVAGLTLATIPSFVIWVVSGLENSLFAFGVVWLAVLLFVAARKDNLLSWKVATAAGLLVAFCALTRPDGLIYAGAYPLAVLWQLRRPLLGTSIKHVLISLAAFAIPFGAYVAWRHSEFGGRLLANPSIAKQQGLPDLTSIIRPGALVLYIGVAAVVVVAALIVWAMVKAPWRRALYVLLTPFALGIVAFGVLIPDWMDQYRFATPVWALGALAGTMCLAEFLRTVKAPVVRVVALVVVIASLVPSAIGFVKVSDKFIKSPTIPACLVADRFGRGFNTIADMLGLQQASLLLPDLGGSSMTSRLQLVDMAGLVEANVADYLHKDDIHGLRDYVFDKVKPTFIHSWGPWASGNGIAVDPRIDQDYYPIFVYPGPGLRNGDFVRKDAVTDMAKLEAVRHYAATTMMNVEGQHFVTAPLDDCGPTMKPGQTIAPRG
ncbi:hypothetical protein [Amycolatopsis sp. NPDC058986]|uniref:hypothetical protein n=1 Tax=unclassified Amycolatopsis TaxID=2618356 RepID=UPI00366D9E9B